MKITCERCRAEYDIADAKIPASGFKMTCPTCQNEITSAPPPASGPREIALSLMEDDAVELPKPVAKPSAKPPGAAAPISVPSISDASLAEVDFAELVPAAPAMSAPEISLASDEPDLPAPVARGSAPPPLRPAGAKPSAPSAPAPMDKDIVDLPAPRTRSEGPRVTADAGVDLPAPKPPSARPPTPPTARPPVPGARLDASAPSSGGPEVVDLPSPVANRSAVDLPRPKTPPPVPGRPPAVPLSTAPGPEATGDPDFAIPLDLDAPDIDDAGDVDAGADLLTPKLDGGVDLPTPRADAGGLDLPTPRGARGDAGEVDLPGPVTDNSSDLPTPREPGHRPATPPAQGSVAVEPEEPKPVPRRKIMLFAGIGAIVVVGGAAIAIGLVSSNATRRALEVKLVAARRAIADDTASGLQTAMTGLKPLTSGEKASDDAIALEAQAHFLLARLGVAGELTAGRALLDRAAEGPPSAERRRAEGLRALAMGDLSNARKILKEVLQAAPTDAATLSYLGWVDQMGRDPVTAASSFSRALGVEPARAQAAYGLGVAKERLGDVTAAKQAYAKAVAAAPEHLRARLGQLRLDARSGEPEAATKLDVFVAEHASAFTPREQAEGMVTIGEVALAAGRRDEAEDRFGKALVIDTDAALSLSAADARLGLARARIDAGRGAEVIESLRKILVIDARGLEVRVLLTEALLDKQDTKEATTQLAIAEKIAPKDARIAYLRGRLLLAHPTVAPSERAQAIERFREATAADPKLLVAWAALARNLNALGRTPDAVEALDKAAGALAADARGAAMLGAAYLAIGRPADAEARFRAVLAADEGKPASPERLPVRMGLGDALEAQNKLEEADTAYADAMKVAPKSAGLLERRGRLAVRRNKPDEARTFFDEAVQVGNPTVSLRLAAGELAFKSGRMPEARQLVESAMKDDERSALACLLLARIEVATGHAGEALGLARRAATLQDLPEAHLLLGQLLEGMGKLEGAATEFNLARRPPVAEAASLGRARILLRMGATHDALAELDPLVKSGGVRAEALLLAGDCYSDLQAPDKARHAYEDAAKIAPSSADAAFKLGRAELDAGKRRPGLDALERAIKLGDAKASWMADAYLLVGDARRLGRESEAAIRAYMKYLALAPPTAPMRAEVARQITLLGGTPPGSP